VIAGPGDETPGAGHRGRLRASHADRDEMVEVLKAAFVQGRLTQDEFDQRLDRVLASRTYADLAALTADIPPALIRAQPPKSAHPPAAITPMRITEDKKVIRTWAGVTCVLPALVVAMAAMESGQPVVVGLVVALVFACLVGLPVSGLVLLNSRYEKRSGHGIG
jgi:DUF1707 SHOCT-like domain